MSWCAELVRTSTSPCTLSGRGAPRKTSSYKTNALRCRCAPRNSPELLHSLGFLGFRILGRYEREMAERWRTVDGKKGKSYYYYGLIGQNGGRASFILFFLPFPAPSLT